MYTFANFAEFNVSCDMSSKQRKSWPKSDWHFATKPGKKAHRPTEKKPRPRCIVLAQDHQQNLRKSQPKNENVSLNQQAQLFDQTRGEKSNRSWTNSTKLPRTPPTERGFYTHLHSQLCRWFWKNRNARRATLKARWEYEKEMARWEGKGGRKVGGREVEQDIEELTVAVTIQKRRRSSIKSRIRCTREVEAHPEYSAHKGSASKCLQRQPISSWAQPFPWATGQPMRARESRAGFSFVEKKRGKEKKGKRVSLKKRKGIEWKEGRKSWSLFLLIHELKCKRNIQKKLRHPFFKLFLKETAWNFWFCNFSFVIFLIRRSLCLFLISNQSLIDFS